MKERYYDLNGREDCVTAIIELSGKTFRISRVVIAARVLYSNHLTEMADMLKRISSYDEEKDSDGKEADSLMAEAEEFGKRKMETYDRILTLLLEKNGYGYDKTWWDENTDELDRMTFIERSMMKDSDGKKKLKARPER